MRRKTEVFMQIQNDICKWNMLCRQDKIIVGISGGADSVCLLFVLWKLQPKYGYELEAVHVHHGIRGEEADRDEAFVKQLCGTWDIPLYTYHYQVPQQALQWKMTEEEAGRRLRREAFEQTCAETGATRIALAHHQEDNAETMLLNLCRGTGLTGLAGIRPVHGRYIRPLLSCSKGEILKLLQEEHLEYCEDSTNEELRYGRNKIRHQILPCLTEEINAETVLHMNETMEELGQIREYLDREVRRIYPGCMDEDEILEEKIKGIEPVIQDMILKRALIDKAGCAKDVERRHVRLLRQLFDRQPGKELNLPYRIRAERTYRGVRLRTGTRRMSVDGTAESALTIFPAKDADLEAFLREEKRYTKWFDYDIIGKNTLIRTRQPGDYLIIDDQGGKQKVKDWFINAKIPREMRDQILLLVEGSHVYWIIGYRQASDGKVTEHTKEIAQWEIGERYGRAD